MLADAYRVTPSAIQSQKPHEFSARVNRRNRLYRFTQAICQRSGGEPLSLIDSFLRRLELAGHQGGIIDIGKMHFSLAGHRSRLALLRCGRIHMHIGAGIVPAAALLYQKRRAARQNAPDAKALSRQTSLTFFWYSPDALRKEADWNDRKPGGKEGYAGFKGILIADDDILPEGMKDFAPDRIS